MPNKKNGGLCSTCNNAPGCTHCVAENAAVWECEEYEDAVPAPARTAFDGSAAAREAPFWNARGAEETAGYKGLCVDCENRAACSYEKAEGGVWHCEDYR